MTQAEIVELLRRAYKLGFGASSEGYNAEYPFGDDGILVENVELWVKSREIDLFELYEEIGVVNE